LLKTRKISGLRLNTPKNYKELKISLIGELIQKKARNSGLIILTLSLKEEMRVFGLQTMGSRHI